jgi:hypothetical protein
MLKGVELQGRLLSLASQSRGIDVAVAWATDWEGLSRILDVAKCHGKSCVRMIVGVSDYFTSPKALKAMDECAELRIHGTPSGLLFHPKLYVFHLPDSRVCWVGSANLTKRAFNENVEAVAEFTDTNGAGKEHFLALWVSNKLRSIVKFDLEGYEKEWEKRRVTWPHQKPVLAEEDDAPEEKVTASSPANKINLLTAGWAEYVDRLHRSGDDLDVAIKTLDAGADFVSRDWKLDISEREKRIMFGHGFNGEDFSPFGRLRLGFAKNFCGPSQKSKNRRTELGKILSEARTAKVFIPEMARKFFEGLIDLDGCGPALATRLLVLARPDWFIVVNKKSFKGLTKEFSIPVKTDIKPAKYAELVQRIQQQPWWKTPRPDNPTEATLWKYRAALIDRLVYTETSDGFAED